jgi:hypothetical protein
MNASMCKARLRAIGVCGALLSLTAGHVAPAADAPNADTIVERVRADLAARRKIPRSEIQTVTVNEVIWRDTSLGCGKPTESHAEIDVEGWRIALEYKGERFDYRARKDGGFILCNAGLPTPRSTQPRPFSD